MSLLVLSMPNGTAEVAWVALRKDIRGRGEREHDVDVDWDGAEARS